MFSLFSGQRRGIYWYLLMLFFRSGDINENSLVIYLVTSSSSWGQWIQDFEPCYAIPVCSRIFLYFPWQAVFEFYDIEMCSFFVCLFSFYFDWWFKKISPFNFFFFFFLVRFWKSKILCRSFYHFTWEIPCITLKLCIILYCISFLCICQ